MAELLIERRGSTWQYKFEIPSSDGKRRRISKGGFKTKSDAVRAGTKAKAEFDSVGAVFTPSTVTVETYLDYFMKSYVVSELRVNSEKVYRQFIENYFKPAWGRYQLCKITPLQIRDMLNEAKSKGLGYNTVKHMKNCLNRIFDYAVDPCNFIHENPARRVKMPKFEEEQVNPHKLISKADFNCLMKRFPFGDRYHIMLVLCWTLGLRIGEVCGLVWDDFDFENGTVAISHQATGGRDGRSLLAVPKTKASMRTISFGEELKNLLMREKERQERNEEEYGEYYSIVMLKGDEIVECQKQFNPSLPRIRLVCIDDNGRWTNPNSSRYVTRIAKQELGIEFDFHSLRHSNATHLLDAGVDIKVVQKRLGHKSIATTYDSYIHVTKQMDDVGRLESDALLCT